MTVRELRLMCQKAEREGCAQYKVQVRALGAKSFARRIRLLSEKLFSFGWKGSPALDANEQLFVVECD